MLSTVSSFKRERGISLETLNWERASSRIEGRIPWFSSRLGGKFGVPLDLRRGAQDPAHITSWKSGLILSCDVHLRIPHKSLQGRYSSDRLVVQKLHVPLQWGQGSPGCVQGSPGESALVLS